MGSAASLQKLIGELKGGKVKTLVDDGYIDMHRVMEGLHRTGFDGILLPDHVPGDGRHAAYTLGYMRAVRKQVCQL